jgi:hypothetical protein
MLSTVALSCALESSSFETLVASCVQQHTNQPTRPRACTTRMHTRYARLTGTLPRAAVCLQLLLRGAWRVARDERQPQRRRAVRSDSRSRRVLTPHPSFTRTAAIATPEKINHMHARVGSEAGVRQRKAELCWLLRRVKENDRHVAVGEVLPPALASACLSHCCAQVHREASALQGSSIVNRCHSSQSCFADMYICVSRAALGKCSGFL